MTEIPYVRQPADFSTPVRYAHGPDSYPQPGVPRGTILDYEWTASRVFPGTSRRYWVYVPAQYTASEPASLMVFQDGHMYLDPEGEIRAAVVFDNLIHRGEMPVTIGVFVADQWAIGGGSSGGSCAFTVAWTRPDRFRRVLSFLGSFAQIRGGNPYPDLIHDIPPKPLRVFLQAATRDLNWDADELNWFSANLRVAAALADRGYDLRLVLGDGGHDPNHGGAILPDALRWLWRRESE